MLSGWPGRFNLKFAAATARTRHKEAAMLLRNKGSKETYNVPSGVGKAMIHAGMAEEVLAAAPKQTPRTNWSANEGRYAGIDYQYPPYVYVNCSTCAQRQWVENVSPAFAFRHCGVVEKIPNTVLAQYQALLKAYKFRSRKAPTLTVDTATVDRLVMAARGIKTRDELLQEHIRSNELGRKKG
jgi:hypothetical protein